MPDPDYLQEGKGPDAETFQKELDKLSDGLEDQRKEAREREREDLEKRLEEGDPSAIQTPMPARDAGGPQGNPSTGADDQVFGPVQVDPHTAGASEEEKEANREVLDVAAAEQDVNQGDGSKDDVKAAKEEAKGAVKESKKAREDRGKKGAAEGSK